MAGWSIVGATVVGLVGWVWFRNRSPQVLDMTPRDELIGFHEGRMARLLDDVAAARSAGHVKGYAEK